MTASPIAGWGRGLALALLVLGASTAAGARGPATFAASSEPAAPPSLAAPEHAAAAGEAPALAAPPEPASTPPEPAGSELEALWQTAGSRTERVERVRSAARARGVPSFDAAARAVLRDAAPGERVAAAHDAVALAPELPLARAAYAVALWQEGGSPGQALRALAEALPLLARHLEASLWLEANAFHAAALALFFGALAFFAVVFAGSARTLAHDLGDRLSLETPAFGRVLLLGGVVLAPAAFGAGALGLALGLFAVLTAWGDARLRRALAAAALLATLGLHPVLDLAGRATAALTGDPVALAALAVESETVTAGELTRLARAEHDPIARRALAVRARRSGDLAAADARYAELLDGADPSLVNNAANVRLALGDVPGAIALYERADAAGPSPVLLFNLSHAYGAAIEPDLQDATLARAQALDAAAIDRLTDLMAREARGLAVDLPLSAASVRARLLAGPNGPGTAAALRRPLAPGRAGGSVVATLVAFGVAGLVGMLLGRGHAASRRCDVCGTRRCPRCDDPAEARSGCDACARIGPRSDAADTTLRAERLAALHARRRRRERGKLVADVFAPGAAGLLSQRPLLGVIGALPLAGAFFASGLAGETVVDPLAAGLAAQAARLGAVALLLLLHGGVVLLARAQRGD